MMSCTFSFRKSAHGRKCMMKVSSNLFTRKFTIQSPSPSPNPSRLNNVRRSGSNKFLMVGLPLIGFCIGGYMFLAEFMKTHVEMKDQKQKATSSRVFEIEEEYNVMMKGLDINSYKLSAVPRPGESVQKKEKKKINIPMVKPNAPS